MQTFDVERLRAEFPALTRHNGAPAPVFFDNPGGTQVPGRVIDAITDCLTNANANLGGAFRTSIAADDIFAEAHLAMADFMNAASPREIIFGQNMTSLTLHISRSIARLLGPGDEILLTRMEHDANVAPWLLVARDSGATVKFLPFDHDSYEFDLDPLDDLLTPRTKLVCINHASNLTGTINDVKSITAKAKSVGAMVYVDSVQFAPHGKIDVQDLGCDFLVCSPYKFYGPHMGVLWGREEVLRGLEPYKVRAVGDDLPGCFETGTLSHEAMAGVTACIDYFAWIGRDLADESYRRRHADCAPRRQSILAAMDYLTDYEDPLTQRLIEGLKGFSGLKVHGITNPNATARRVPTVSFTVEGHHPNSIAEGLAAEDIYVWSGHNYALEPTMALGLLESGGVVRIGLAHYNTEDEVDRTLGAIARHLSL
jgi:cysteine desulfurase family protein (TIGR01976 family)